MNISAFDVVVCNRVSPRAAYKFLLEFFSLLLLMLLLQVAHINRQCGWRCVLLTDALLSSASS